MGASPVYGVGRRDPGTLVVVTPPQLVANTDNWNPSLPSTGLGVPVYEIRVSTDASRNLTGFQAAAYDGMRIFVVNVGAQDLVFKNADTGSEEINRFITSTGGDYTLTPNGWALMIYDMTSQRWRV